MRDKPSGPITTFIFGVILLVIGGALAYFLGWPMIVDARASRSWPSTPGKITVSRVESHRDKNKTMYSHRVEYTFAVDGVQHQGNRVGVSDGWSSSTSSGAKRTVSRYPVGSETTVYYDPDAHDVCALQTGATWSTYLIFGIGSLLFLIGALMVGTSLFKLLAATLMIGAAVTGAVGQSTAPPSRQYAGKHDLPHSATGDDDDDGIEIT